MKTEILKEVCSRDFANGVVYALKTEDEYPIEVTDTFLPFYTKDAIGRKQNGLKDSEIGNGQEIVQVSGGRAFNILLPCPVCEGKGVVPKEQISFLMYKWGL